MIDLDALLGIDNADAREAWVLRRTLAIAERGGAAWRAELAAMISTPPDGEATEADVLAADREIAWWHESMSCTAGT